MKIGLTIGGDGSTSLEDLIAQGVDAEKKGFSAVWMPQIFGVDAIMALTLIGRATSKIELGTAVVPTYPRHPTAIAQQALTAGVATGGRFNLGIGLSHKIVTEDMLGFSYEKPARHMREYLSVLMSAIRGETVAFNGEEYRVNGFQIDIKDAEPTPVLVAALGPVMLKLAGELADGTVTWMVGQKTLETHIIPSIRKGADGAGKPNPQVAAGFPVILTNNPDDARAKINEALTIYGQLPSYRAMLDREGAASPGDVAIAGGENVIRDEIARLRDMGVTYLNAAVMPVEEGAGPRTVDFLASL
jgi:F420-dependent oxidoreductase-like protein